jgi:hypothetical protein
MGINMRLGLYVGKTVTARKASIFDTVILDKNSQIPHASLDTLTDFLAAAQISLAYLDGNRIITLNDRLLSTLHVLEGNIEVDPMSSMIQRPAIFRIKRSVAGIPIDEIVDALVKRAAEIQSSRDALNKNLGELKKMMTVSFKDNVLVFEIRYFNINNIDEFDVFLREAKVVLGDSRINIVVNALVFATIENTWGMTTLPFIFNYLVNALSNGENAISVAGIEQNFRVPWLIISNPLGIRVLADSDYLGAVSALTQRIRRWVR